MSIDALQLRHEIIRPVLKHLEPAIPYSMAAENLLMGTCAQESRMGQFIVQLDNGPAKGIFQMEPETYYDIYENYVDYRSNLKEVLEELVSHVFEPEQLLTGNLFYAAAMCRVHYWRQPEALPDENDVEGMANFWKIRYNSLLGAGTEEEFIANYQRYVA